MRARGTALGLLFVVLTMSSSAQAPANRTPVVRSTLTLPSVLGPVMAAAVDAAGNTYVTGYTGATAATTPGVFQPTPHGGGYDAFAEKFDAAGKLAWATYIGGSAYSTLARAEQNHDDQVEHDKRADDLQPHQPDRLRRVCALVHTSTL